MHESLSSAGVYSYNHDSTRVFHFLLCGNHCEALMLQVELPAILDYLVDSKLPHSVYDSKVYQQQQEKYFKTMRNMAKT